jgi:hypothetical protein
MASGATEVLIASVSVSLRRQRERHQRGDRWRSVVATALVFRQYRYLTPDPSHRLLFLLGVAALAAACGDDEGCIAVAVGTDLVVDVSALPDAERVCLDGHCMSVLDGSVHFAEGDSADTTSLLPKPMTDAELRVTDSDGRLVRPAEEIEVPGYFADGRSCGSYAPRGTVVVESDEVKGTGDIVK